MDVIVSRCAGLDVHKDTVMACVRAPGPDGGRTSTVRRFGTFTDSLRQLRAWLVAEGVTQVAMEATGVYWKPVWHVLEAVGGWELLLANAHAVKNMPGRKTDVADAEWLAMLCECGLLRPSFVPPPVIAELRDLTRYRKKLIEERTRETQRVQNPGSAVGGHMRASNRRVDLRKRVFAGRGVVCPRPPVALRVTFAQVRRGAGR